MNQVNQMHQVQGLCGEAYSDVKESFRQNLDEGADIGASFAVTRDGETIIDIWGGYQDEARKKLWQADTIVNVYSTTKTLAALCLHLLSDRGEVALDAPVSRYWPEFAQNGKEKVEVRHFLSHASGLPGFDEPTTQEDLYDWEKITDRLARQAPWWEPGTQSGYHAITQGFLIGEVVRRVSGRTIGQFLADEITGPLGTDFHIGTGAEHDARIGELIPPEDEEAARAGISLTGEFGKIAVRVMTNPTIEALTSRTQGWRRAEIPAANGHGNARAVAETLSVLANDGAARGKTLLTRAGARRILELQTDGFDAVLGIPVRWGLGYALPSELVPIGPNPHSCFWGGYGGSFAMVDMDARVTISYVMNRMVASLLDQTRVARLVMSFYGALASGTDL